MNAGDAEQIRQAIKRFMKARGLEVSPWARDAGVADSTLRNFLGRQSQSMRLDILMKFAGAVDSTVSEIIGEVEFSAAPQQRDKNVPPALIDRVARFCIENDAALSQDQTPEQLARNIAIGCSNFTRIYRDTGQLPSAADISAYFDLARERDEANRAIEEAIASG